MRVTENLEGKTPLYPISLDIRNELLRQIREHLTKWEMFSANWKLETETYHGKPIRYSGITFEGSPRHVFWGRYIEPFLENGIKKGIAQLEEHCRSKNLNPVEYLPELQELLQPIIGWIYREMAIIDLSLMNVAERSKKKPKPVIPVDVDNKIATMEEYLKSHFVAAMHQGENKLETELTIDSELEFELLGAFHCLFFDETNKLKKRYIYFDDLYLFYFKNSLNAEELNESLRSLQKKKLIAGHKSDPRVEARMLDSSRPMRDFELIELTPTGTAITLNFVEDYWIYLQNWKSKYPGLTKKLIPSLKTPSDWEIIKKLYELVSWKTEYTIDEDEARKIIDAGRKLPYFGAFSPKTNHTESQIVFFDSYQTPPDYKQRNHVRLLARFKPLVTENFECFQTAKKYYETLTKSFPDIRGQYKPVAEFMTIISGHLDGVEPPNDVDSFIDHLGSTELIHFGKQGTGVGVALNQVVDSTPWEKWERNQLKAQYNPQTFLKYQISSGNTIRVNSTGLHLVEMEKRTKGIISDTLEDLLDDNTIVSGETKNRNFDSNRKLKNGESEEIVERHKYFSLVSLAPKIKEPFIFVIMPFDNKVVRQTYYKDVIRKFLVNHTNYGCYRSDDDKQSLKVDNKIFTMINKAKLIIADVTKNNPNVMYELGMAHALEKDVILITNRNQKEMPFDIGGVHAEKYKDGKELKKILKKQLEDYGIVWF